MSLGLETFRASKGDRVILNQPLGQETGVVKAELPFRDRVVNFFKHGNAKYGTVQQQTQNRDFKVAFSQALIKAEGAHIANLAARKAGLPVGWEQSAKPISAKKVRLVLENAQHYRQKAVKQTEHNVKLFLKGTNPPSFATTFNALGAALPPTDVNNPKLHALFRREVKLDPGYAKNTLGPAQLQTIAQRAIQKFAAQKQEAFREQHPGLAQYVQHNHVGTPREDQRSFFAELTIQLAPSMGGGHPLSGEPSDFRYLAQNILNEVETNKDLLSQMRYDPDGMRALGNDLIAKFDRLHQLEQRLGALAGPQLPNTAEGQHLMQALAAELRHQKELLLAKAGFLDDVRDNDPLSKKMVAYSNLLWAHAVGKIFDEAIAYVTANSPHGANDPAIAQLNQAKTAFIAMQQTNYNNAPIGQRTTTPGTVSKEEHPATIGKTTAKQYLEAFLTQAGLPPDQIKALTSSKHLGDMRRQALNENQTWAPIQRDMVVTKDGVTRIYRSKITPGGSINPRFARLYNQSGVQGISSATKSDPDHARNLKVSELELVNNNGTTKTKAKVIGHGVLDMWDIPYPNARQAANKNGAREVLEAAIVTNDRIRTEALNRAQTNDPTPVKITHVSVNLITPAGWRELPGLRGTDKLHDYQEQTYTFAQFDAFHANTTERNGAPLVFRIDDDRPHGTNLQDVNINVDVDVISFSFGINPLATGRMPDFMGGWASVYDHNARMMVKFVGDLGTGEFGSVGSRPGGFIGSVMDRLNPNTPAEAELLSKLQEQTDLVRSMFTHEDFKRGNGDPAKMGRHILTLQALAEEALSVANVTDHAATMSKGCKSDKDRGGVTDVEFKHLLITEDMGGHIEPDTRLESDDQQNYYVVASSSGQLENQLYNTGLPGSKEAGKLKTRIPDPIVRQYLSGLGAFASE